MCFNTWTSSAFFSNVLTWFSFFLCDLLYTLQFAVIFSGKIRLHRFYVDLKALLPWRFFFVVVLYVGQFWFQKVGQVVVSSDCLSTRFVFTTFPDVSSFGQALEKHSEANWKSPSPWTGYKTWTKGITNRVKYWWWWWCYILISLTSNKKTLGIMCLYSYKLSVSCLLQLHCDVVEVVDVTDCVTVFTAWFVENPARKCSGLTVVRIYWI